MNGYRLMVVVMVLLGLMTTGCAGLDGFEIRNTGMGAAYTNAVNRAGEKLAKSCAGGVEYDYRFYRHESKPRVENPEYRYFYTGNETTTTSRFHVECQSLPTDLPNEKKQLRRPQ